MVKPVLTQATTSVHKVIETTITHIHYALIFRATAMQRIATALVRKRQQQLRRKFIHGTTNRKTTHNPTREPPPHQSQPQQRDDITPTSTTPTRRVTSGVTDAHRRPQQADRPHSKRALIQLTLFNSASGTPTIHNNTQRHKSLPCTHDRCNVAVASGSCRGTRTLTSPYCQQCYRFERTLLIADRLEHALRTMRDVRRLIAQETAYNIPITVLELYNVFRRHPELNSNIMLVTKQPPRKNRLKKC